MVLFNTKRGDNIVIVTEERQEVEFNLSKPFIFPKKASSKERFDFSLSSCGTFYEVSIKRLKGVKAIFLVIPKEYNGLPIKTLSGGDCEGGEGDLTYTTVYLHRWIENIEREALSYIGVQRVYLEEGIELKYIDPNAFDKCKELREILGSGSLNIHTASQLNNIDRRSVYIQYRF